MPTFQEALKLARLSMRDNTSRKRLHEIVQIARRHDVRSGLTPEKAVAILQELGPTFVKLGQIASTHPDVLPKEYCDAFCKLHADVTPLPFETVKQTIESELGLPVEEVFSEVDEHPLGSASVAQVHRAKLKDGTVVAVKVHRPGIAVVIAQDLQLMRRLLATYEFVSTGEGQISFEELLDELERSSRDELDLTVEASYLERFHRNNAGRRGIWSPHAYVKWSTQSMLTMDFAQGRRLGAEGVLSEMDARQRERLAYLIAQNFMEQCLEDGFFHADPHAGNIMVGQDGESIEWIDFGIMGELTASEREAVRDVMVAIAKQDAHGLMKAVLRIVRPTGPMDHSALLTICDDTIRNYASADLDEFDTGALLQELVITMGRSGFEFNPSILMLARGLVTLEGTIHMVSGKVSINSVIGKYMTSHLDPERLGRHVRTLAEASVDSLDAAVSLPTKLDDTLDMLQKGQVKTALHFSADKTTREEIGNSIDHFTLAIIAGSLIMGSCLLCMTALEPRVMGVPVFGVFCFVLGSVIASWDLLWMRRDSKRRR